MKPLALRTLSVLMVILLTAGLFADSSSLVAEAVLGDVNADQNIDATDAFYALQSSVQLTNLNENNTPVQM